MESDSLQPRRSGWIRDTVLILGVNLVITASVNLQMPLYRHYAEAAGMGTSLTGLVFCAYVAGLLPTLIFLAGLSDRWGRKAVLLSALACAFLASAVMAWRPTLGHLFLARLAQGLAVGLGVGTATTYLTERLQGIKPSSFVAAGISITSSLGFGLGALFTGTLILFHPTETPISYPVLAALAVVFWLGLMRVPDSGKRPAPLISFPLVARRFWPEFLSIAMAWAATGVVIAILPTELHHHGLGGFAGHALFLVNLSGALWAPVARRQKPATNLWLGYLLLPTGMAGMLLSASHGFLVGLGLSAVMAGSACYGFLFYGGLSRVNEVPDGERARSVAGFFLLAYVGFGLPSLLLGLVSDRVGVFPALTGFCVLLGLGCAWLALRLKFVK